MENKEKETIKKEEKVLDKEFHNQNKTEEIEIKNFESNSKLNETKFKMGEKINKYKALDNSTKKGKILRTIIVFFVLSVLIIGGYLLLKYTGVLDKFDSLEDVKQFILSGGKWSVFVFIAIQFLQVTFLPIPSIITTLSGALIFGALNSFIMSLLAIMLGSIFAFYLGRKFGKGILTWIAGKEDADKWTRKLTNGKYMFFLMMLFPVFPDDVLCIAAGVTNISFKFFFITNLITRPIAIFCTCFLGSGSLIPYSGYGLIVWPILIVLLIILFILSIKYKTKIEEFMENFTIKKNIKNKIKKENEKKVTEKSNVKENENKNTIES